MNETRRGFLAKIGLGVLALVGGAKLAEAKDVPSLLTGEVERDHQRLVEAERLRRRGLIGWHETPSAASFSTEFTYTPRRGATTLWCETSGGSVQVEWEAQTRQGDWVPIQIGETVDVYTKLRSKITVHGAQTRAAVDAAKAKGFDVVGTCFVPRPEDDEEARFWASDEGQRAVATLTGMGM